MTLDLPSLTVVVRESLEAFLILSILAGLVMKLGHPELRKWLLWGAAAAVVASVLAGIAIFATLEKVYGDMPAELFAGVASLVAVGILVYMIVWMYRHTLTLVEEMRHRVHGALDAGRPWLLFAIAFVAVAREGVETVLFLGSQSAQTAGTTLLVSLLLGLTISATLAWLLFAGVVRLNLRKFFAASGILLIFFAGGILVYGLHELSEVGIVPGTAKVWDLEDAYGGLLNHKTSWLGILLNTFVGYRHNLTVLELGAYVAFVGGLLAWYVRGIVKTGRGVTLAVAPARAP